MHVFIAAGRRLAAPVGTGALVVAASVVLAAPAHAGPTPSPTPASASAACVVTSDVKVAPVAITATRFAQCDAGESTGSRRGSTS
jgi:hypothetical protein